MTAFLNVQTALLRSSDPAVAPVTTTAAKRHLRVDHSDEDSYIADLVLAATAKLEDDTSLALVQQTWTLSLDCWPDVIQLRRPPVSSVTSVTYLDANGDSQTWAATNYDVGDLANARAPARITRSEGQTYPVLRSAPNAVTVTFVAGYGATASSVPVMAQHAIKLLVSHWYCARESVSSVRHTEVPQSYESLVNLLRWRPNV